MRYLAILLLLTFASCRRCGDCEQHQKVQTLDKYSHALLYQSDNIIGFTKECGDDYQVFQHESDTISVIQDSKSITYTIKYKICK